MNNIYGFKVIQSIHLCRPEFVRWCKNHRKKRINKKWHKKYGAIYACKGHAYQVAGVGVVACPCILSKLRKLRELHVQNMVMGASPSILNLAF